MHCNGFRVGARWSLLITRCNWQCQDQRRIKLLSLKTLIELPTQILLTRPSCPSRLFQPNQHCLPYYRGGGEGSEPRRRHEGAMREPRGRHGPPTPYKLRACRQEPCVDINALNCIVAFLIRHFQYKRARHQQQSFRFIAPGQ